MCRIRLETRGQLVLSFVLYDLEQDPPCLWRWSLPLDNWGDVGLDDDSGSSEL